MSDGRLERGQVEEILPLTAMQQGLLLLHLAEPPSGAYHEQLTVELEPPVDAAALQRATVRLFEHHGALRTVLRWDRVSAPVQLVLKQAARAIVRVDADDLAEAGGIVTPWGVRIPYLKAPSEARPAFAPLLTALRKADLEVPFDLESAAVRAYVVTADEEAALLLAHHHILLDGWSSGLLVGDLLAEYADLRCVRQAGPRRSTSPRALLLHRAEYERSPDLTYWGSYLSGARPTSLPRPPGHGSPPVLQRVEWQQTAEDRQRLDEACRVLRVTPAACFLASWGLLLQRWTESPDVLTGYTVSGRDPSVPGSETAVGMLVNTLALRVACGRRMTVSELLQATQRDLLEHSEREYHPLAAAHRQVLGNEEGELFDSLVVVENYPVDRALKKHPDLRVVRIDEQTHYRATLTLADEGAWTARLALRCGRDDDAQAATMLAHWAWLLEQMLNDPSRAIGEVSNLSLDLAEELLVAVHRNVAEPPPEDETVVEGLLAAVERWPQRVALVDRAEHLTYLELGRRVDTLARVLVEHDVRPGDFVCLRTRRDVTTLVALLGVMRCGAAVVPVADDAPAGRVEELAHSCGWRLELVQGALEDAAGRRCLDLSQSLSPADAQTPLPCLSRDLVAYVFHTSGSTGRPKGILGSHAGLLRLVSGASLLRVRDGEAVLMTSAPIFDVSIYTLFSTLLHGGKVVVPAQEELLDADEIERWVIQEEIGRLFLITPLFNSHVGSGAGFFRHLSHVLVGGAPMSAPHARRLLERHPDLELVNTYGTTECGVWSTEQAVTLSVGERVPIGRALPGTRLCVLDRHGHLLPPGAVGELALGGVGVGLGYVGDPAQTAACFVPDPHAPGARLYLTGDRAAWLPDLSLDYLGRRDRQVKVRGHRIEIGEIEQRLLEQPEIREAAVVPCGRGDALVLVAFVVGPQTLATAEVGDALRCHLPEHMLPTRIERLDALPRLATGKVDMAHLEAMASRAPTRASAAPAALCAAPAGGRLEEEVSAVWRQVLGVEDVGRDEAFFTLGGTSLDLIKVQGLLHRQTGHRLSVADLFRHPTVRSLAQRLAAAGPAEPVAEPVARQVADGGAVAVVGMAGRFPGASDIDELWQLILRRGEGIRRFARDELLAFGERPEALDDPRYVAARGVLDDVEWFDGAFFGYSPRESEIMDPQIRLLHECCWDALEDATCAPDRFAGRIGVYAGLLSNPCWWSGVAEALDEGSEAYAAAVLNVHSVASLVAHSLDLSGPAVTVDTSCSTSAVAIHLACQALRVGDCELALAGGVSVEMPIHRGYLHTEGLIFASDGHCRPFDAAANGTVAGDGVAVVALKRLDRALADRDRVYAVIRGSAINNDGRRKVGYTAPSVDGQLAALRDCHRQAGFEAGSIGLVEAHGTGTRLGDPVEVEALRLALGDGRAASCALGSVKSNIGHLNRAAGAAGLIKAALAIERRWLPPSANFASPNPEVSFAGSPLYVNTAAKPWEGPAPRRAVVSSFGIGGTNCHLALEEPGEGRTAASEPRREVHLLPFSAPSPEQLRRRVAATAHRAWSEGASLDDVAFTLQTGRAAQDYRQVFMVDGGEDAAPPEAVLWTLPSLRGEVGDERPECAFLFPGQGVRDAGQVRALYAAEGTFCNLVDDLLARLDGLVDFEPGELLTASPEQLSQTRFAQPWTFVVEHALATMLQTWGVRPDCMIGHSLGEYVAATLAGVFALDDALRLVALRGRWMQEMAPGRMLSVLLDEEQARRFLDEHEDLELAVVNGRRACVLAGPVESAERAAAELARRGVAAVPLPTSHAFHTRSMEPMLRRLEEALRGLRLAPPSTPFVSNLTGTWITAEQAVDPTYWTSQARRTVRFDRGLDELLAAPRLLLEVGPGKALSDLARRHGKRRPETVVPSLPPSRGTASPSRGLYDALASLWVAGVAVDWTAFSAGHPGRRIGLPGLAWMGRRCWRFGAQIEGAGADARPGLLPQREWLRRASWQPMEVGWGRETPQAEVVLCGADPAQVAALEDALRSRGVKCATMTLPQVAAEEGLPDSGAERPRLDRGAGASPHLVLVCPSADDGLASSLAMLPLMRQFFEDLLAGGVAFSSLLVLGGGAFEVLPDDPNRPEASAAWAATEALSRCRPDGPRVAFADALVDEDGAQAVIDALTAPPAAPRVVAYRRGRVFERAWVPWLSSRSRDDGPDGLSLYWLLGVGEPLAASIAAEIERSHGGATVLRDDWPTAELADGGVDAARLLGRAAEIAARGERLAGVVTAPEGARCLVALITALESSDLWRPGLDLLIFNSAQTLRGEGTVERCLDAGFLDGVAASCRRLHKARAVSVAWDGSPSAPNRWESARLTARLLAGGSAWSQVLAASHPIEAAETEAAVGEGRKRAALTADYRAPRNDAERRLVAVLEDYLGVSPIGVDDNYFELGATSLDVVQIRERLVAAWPDVTVVDLFDHPTVAHLAAHLAQARSTAPAVQPGRGFGTAAMARESEVLAAVAAQRAARGDGAAGGRYDRGLLRGFYDLVNRRLDSISAGPLARFLNYGYAADGEDGEAAVRLPAACPNRNSTQLVLEVVGACPLEEQHAVLDVGCGRGGSLAVLREHFHVRRLVGVDLSAQAVEFCTRAYGRLAAPVPRFLVSDAGALPFARASFDRLLNVESSHHYEDIGAFYAEVHRVLKPQGVFLYADMFPAEAVEARLAQLTDAGFALEKHRDVTRNVVLSCDQGAAAHAELFAGSQSEELMAAFLGVPGSENYRALQNRELVYLVLRLRSLAPSVSKGAA